MSTLKFKTNIKCGGCIATVTPYLNKLPQVSHWEVDIQNPDKVLTVEVSEDTDKQQIINTLADAGYQAHEL